MYTPMCGPRHTRGCVVYDDDAYLRGINHAGSPREYSLASTSTGAATRRRPRTTPSATAAEEDEDDDDDHVCVRVSRLARGRVDGVEREAREKRAMSRASARDDVSGARRGGVRGDETGEERWRG